MKPSSHVVLAYHQVGISHSMSLDHFARHVNETTIGLSKPEEKWEPVKFTLQVGKELNRHSSLLALRHNVFENPKWKDELIEIVSDVYGTDIATMRTPSGKSLHDMDAIAASAAGTFIAYDKQGRKVFCEKFPSVPVEYSCSKVSNINAWYDELKTSLPNLIGAELMKCKSVAEIARAVEPKGSLAVAVEKSLTKNKAWSEFVRVNNLRSPLHKQFDHKQAPQRVAAALAESVRTHVEHYIAANAKGLDRQFTVQQLGSSNLIAKQLKSDTATPYNIIQTVASDIFATSTLESQMKYGVYHAPLLIACHNNKDGHKKKKNKMTTEYESSKEQYHPVLSYLHSQIKSGMSKRLPGYIDASMDDTSPMAKYPGNTREVHDKVARLLGLPSYHVATKTKKQTSNVYLGNPAVETKAVGKRMEVPDLAHFNLAPPVMSNNMKPLNSAATTMSSSSSSKKKSSPMIAAASAVEEEPVFSLEQEIEESKKKLAASVFGI